MRVLDVGKQYPVTGVAYSPDGLTLATCGVPKQGNVSVSLWNLTEVAVRRNLSVGADQPRLPVLCFSPSGRFLAISARPKAVLDLEDTSEPPRIRVLDWQGTHLDYVCFGHGGDTVVGLKSGELAALDPRSGKKAAAPKFSIPRKPDFTHYKGLLVGTASGHELALLVRYSLPISWRQGGRVQSHIILTLEANAKSKQRRRHIEFVAKAYSVTRLRLDADGHRVAALVAKTVHVWDVTTGKEVAMLTDRKKTPADFAFSADGRYLGVLFQDSVSLYDTTSWTVARTYAWKVGKLLSLAFSPDGATAAVGSDKGKVVVFDLE